MGDSHWKVLRRRTIYDSDWVRLHRDDVRLPDGTVIDGHHVVDIPRPAAGVVPVGADGQILLIEHHRFITDTTAWEIPAGGIDAGEDLVAAVGRELLEESGLAADRLQFLGTYYPSIGVSNHTFHVFVGHNCRKVAEILDTNEVIRACWFSADEVWAMIERNEIRDGFSLTGLLWYLAKSAKAGTGSVKE